MTHGNDDDPVRRIGRPLVELHDERRREIHHRTLPGIHDLPGNRSLVTQLRFVSGFVAVQMMRAEHVTQPPRGGIVTSDIRFGIEAVVGLFGVVIGDLDRLRNGFAQRLER